MHPIFSKILSTTLGIEEEQEDYERGIIDEWDEADEEEITRDENQKYDISPERDLESDLLGEDWDTSPQYGREDD